jgi:hypothetical protein
MQNIFEKTINKQSETEKQAQALQGDAARLNEVVTQAALLTNKYINDMDLLVQKKTEELNNAEVRSRNRLDGIHFRFWRR